MGRRRSKRWLKKYLRSRERQLATHLGLFLNGFNPGQSLDDELNFRLLLKLRWLVYDFIWVRLKLHPAWRERRWFLDLFDVDQVQVRGDGVELAGDIVWWPEGKDALGEWWPRDHQPYPTRPYKAKIRGDLMGGHWVLEPVRATLKMPRTSKRRGEYEIEFGVGSTYLKVTSRK